MTMLHNYSTLKVDIGPLERSMLGNVFGPSHFRGKTDALLSLLSTWPKYPHSESRRQFGSRTETVDD